MAPQTGEAAPDAPHALATDADAAAVTAPWLSEALLRRILQTVLANWEVSMSFPRYSPCKLYPGRGVHGVRRLLVGQRILHAVAIFSPMRDWGHNLSNFIIVWAENLCQVVLAETVCRLSVPNHIASALPQHAYACLSDAPVCAGRLSSNCAPQALLLPVHMH